MRSQYAFELLSNKILLAKNQNQRHHLHKNKDTGCRSIVKVNQSRAWSRFGNGSTSVSVGTQFLNFNSGRVHKYMLGTARMNVGGGGLKGQICLSEFHWTGRANFLPLGDKHLCGRARFGGLDGESKVGRGQTWYHWLILIWTPTRMSQSLGFHLLNLWVYKKLVFLLDNS